MLDERKMLVLRAIIDDYILSAEPVGSRSIARKHNLGVSPATIRNEMADLEETGYLQQPHVSAGRVPSDKGYRFYVDMLMEPEPISSEARQRIHAIVLNRRQEIEKLIQETSQILSLLTNYTSIVIAPPVKTCVLRHIQMVPLDDHTILVVMVLQPGMVQNKIIRTDRVHSAAELSRMSLVLNDKLRGMTYRDIGKSLVREIRAELGDIGEALLEIVSDELANSGEEHIYLNGTLHIFNQPEFKDIERARLLLSVLEKKDVITALFFELARSVGVQAAIGHENSCSEMQDCSVVTATYQMGGEVIGAIGVIGPTRMEYAKVFSTVELLANALSEILSDLVK